MNKKLMTRKNFEKYELSENAEKELWKNALVIFDTSALIDFYHYSQETRDEIFEKVFPKLKNRLWIPSQVQFEYLKNRESTIEKPIIESYNPIKNKKLSELISAKSKIIEITKQIKEDTSTSKKHPHLPQEKIDNFILFTKNLDKEVQQFEIDLNDEIKKKEEEIKSLQENDTILEAFEKYIEVGTDITFSETMNIVKEGKLRYELKIPPGYMDEKDKEGTQIFGDLIIWKEILAHSKQQQANVIFVCNDLKRDWCIKDPKYQKILSPCLELIKEFNDNNGKRFWMYNQSQFTHRANKYIDIDISNEKIDEISQIIKNRNTDDDLIYICGNCNKKNVVTFEELYLDFKCVGTNERSMGKEYQYDSESLCECDYCNNYTQITFTIYEYPEKSHNIDTVSIDSGKLIQSPDIVTYFWDNYFDEPENLFRD